jgi:IclR family acetate operon transcriptional repressor
MDETRKPTLIASVQRALHLMEAVASHPQGAPAKQLAREARLPLATTYHLLRTLTYEGYVLRMTGGVWVLGDRLDTLHGRGRSQQLLARIRPSLAALRDELGAAVYFGMYEEGEMRIVDIVDAPRTPRVDLWVGFDDAAHATALGKCVLAQLDEASVRDYVARHPLIDVTRNTITEPREFYRRLTPGLSLDHEEYAIGVSCAAVPVTDGTGAVLGALAVSCRTAKLPTIEAAAPRMRATAALVSRTLSFTM